MSWKVVSIDQRKLSKLVYPWLGLGPTQRHVYCGGQCRAPVRLPQIMGTSSSVSIIQFDGSLIHLHKRIFFTIIDMCVQFMCYDMCVQFMCYVMCAIYVLYVCAIFYVYCTCSFYKFIQLHKGYFVFLLRVSNIDVAVMIYKYK